MPTRWYSMTCSPKPPTARCASTRLCRRPTSRPPGPSPPFARACCACRGGAESSPRRRTTMPPTVPSSLPVLFLSSRRDRRLDAVLPYRFERSHGTPEERRNSRDWWAQRGLLGSDLEAEPRRAGGAGGLGGRTGSRKKPRLHLSCLRVSAHGLPVGDGAR